ncbi:MAG: rhomboid family intramembrane serine protease [Candidatus Promineifilaceae bacterium]|nr:rhomboid family intramembrane serine protease [Candidatus Promineifilaceae bacterium]
MFPVSDTEVRGAGPGIVTIALIVINVLVFLLQLTVGGGLEQLFQTYGVVPAEILEGDQLYTLLTSMFLHGGWLHLIGNMLFLWVFGDNVEAAMGHIPYLIFYLLGGLAASAVHILVNSGSTVTSVGASGAVAAILGAYIVMFPEARVRVLTMRAGITRTSALVFIGIWFVMQLFNGIGSLGAETAQTRGVAFFAHIGGFIFGLLGGFFFKGRGEPERLEQSV